MIYQGCHHTFKESQSEEFLTSTKEKYNLPERFILNVGTIEEGKNLLNIRYRDYTNSFRYFTDEMGRNVSIGLDIKLKK